MHRGSKLTLFVVAVMLAFQVGCVGPNKLKRSLDRHLQESYVKHPLRSQLLWPVNLLANHIAAFTDLLILNPLHFWPDVFRGRGTSFDEAVGETESAEEGAVEEEAAEGAPPLSR